MADLIRVLVVDDHPATLGGLVASLTREPDIGQVLEAMSVSEAASVLRAHDVDIILVDFRLPDGTAIDVLKAGEQLARPPAVLILSAFDSPQYVEAAVNLGAVGFLTKTAPLEQVLEAVHAVAAGKTMFTVAQIRGRQGRHWTPLTDREAAIIEGLIQGRSNDELSADLRISKKTVEGYLTRLFEQHGVTTRVELAIKASREGWLDLPHAPRRRRR